MSKLALTGAVALVILLVGAGVVFAQGGPSGYGGGIRGMMNTTASPGTQTTPGNGTYGPGMMGNTNGDGTGMMGNTNGSGMMSGANWDKMRDAMNTGNWDEMVNVCKDAINSQTTPQTNAPVRGNTGTTGTSSPSTATASRTRSMMSSRI